MNLALPQYSQRAIRTGWEGVTGVELGSDEAAFLAKAEVFAIADRQKFLTEIVVFRETSDFHVIDYRRFELDPGEAVKRFTEMYISSWPDGRWPILTVTYHSFYFGADSFGSIMWKAQVDANNGSVNGKVPVAIIKKRKNGLRQEDYLSIKRINASQIEVTGGLTGKTFRYPCGQICAINGQSLFDSW